MFLRLDDEIIENEELLDVFLDTDAVLHFRGRALNSRGEEICKSLLRHKFAKGEIIEVYAETDSGDRFQGFCEVIEIKTEVPEKIEKASEVFRYSGKLKNVE